MLRTIFTIAFDGESKIWDAMRIFLFVYLGIYLGRLGILAELTMVLEESSTCVYTRFLLT
jgi:hypothetical protein